MDAEDPTSPDTFLLQLLNQRRQLIASSNSRTHATIQATNLLLDEEEPPVHGGSRPGKDPNRPRDFEGAYHRLVEHYFKPDPLYPESIFRRRFRMSRHLFLRIARDVEQADHYFVQKADALGKMGRHPLLKITGALRMLAYGCAANCNDEYLQISETTSMASLDHFCDTIVEVYANEYLRRPNVEDLKRLLKIGEKRGFPGMLGSLDCMHWQWKNCPSGWKGQFQGKEKVCYVCSFHSARHMS